MAKKEIKVTVHGAINDKIKKDFHDRLAMILVDQYGVEFCKEILERLKYED